MQSTNTNTRAHKIECSLCKPVRSYEWTWKPCNCGPAQYEPLSKTRWPMARERLGVYSYSGVRQCKVYLHYDETVGEKRMRRTGCSQKERGSYPKDDFKVMFMQVCISSGICFILNTLPIFRTSVLLFWCLHPFCRPPTLFWPKTLSLFRISLDFFRFHNIVPDLR